MSYFVPDPSEDGYYQTKVKSFSARERNRMFIQSDGNFEDVTLVSGADFKEDGRGFALIDFDRDGWLDIAVTSPNEPIFRLLRNTIGDQQPQGSNSVFITLEGGATSAESQQEWSARDAIGASLLVTIGESKRRFQLSSGEGLSTQNGKWIHVGMGEADLIDSVEVVWPSGKRTIKEQVKAGSRIKILENEENSGS
jgi:hypothetical protein